MTQVSRAMLFKRSKLASTLLLVTLSITVGLICSYPGSGASRVGDNVWTWTGLVGIIENVYSHPTNPSTIYAVEEYDQALYRTTDAGLTWSMVSTPDWSTIWDVAIAPSAPNVVYVTASDLYRSTDDGATWQALPLPAETVTGLAVSPADWREVFVMDRSQSSSNVYKSTDGGVSWVTWSTDLPPELYFQADPGPALTIAPGAPHIMIAKPANVSDRSLYKSVDGGRTWSELPGPYHVVQLVVFDPTNSDVIYLGAHFTPGGWKSVDGGVTWFPLAGGLQPNLRDLVIDPDNTQVLHAANDTAGVLESLDGGLSWTQVNTGIQGLTVESIAIGSRNPLVLYAGLPGAGVWQMTRTTVQNYSISINSGALFTNQTAVTLTLTAPPGTTEMMLSNDGGFTGAQWEHFATQKPWVLTSYGETVLTRIVYAQYKTSGAVSGLYTDDIVLDTTAPTGSVTLSEPASSPSGTGAGGDVTLSASSVFTPAVTVFLPAVFDNYRPGFRLGHLTLTADDDLSGVGEMMIGTDPSFVAAVWQPFEAEVSWWLVEGADPGAYVKFRDRAGNESITYSD